MIRGHGPKAAPQWAISLKCEIHRIGNEAIQVLGVTGQEAVPAEQGSDNWTPALDEGGGSDIHFLQSSSVKSKKIWSIG